MEHGDGKGMAFALAVGMVLTILIAILMAALVLWGIIAVGAQIAAIVF